MENLSDITPLSFCMETNDSICEPFDPCQVHVYSRTMMLGLIVRRIEQNAVELHPEFQRNEGVWNATAQSRLIESLLIRIPLPAFYFDSTDDNRWLVIDGLQRLSTIRKFVLEGMRLKNLEFLHDCEGKTYQDLPPPLQRRIDESELMCYLIMPGTPWRVKYDIFRRINTGGEPLSAQEIRHALNVGPCTEIIKAMAECPSFKRVIKNGISPRRMKDRECVLRFLAFYHSEISSYAGGDLNAFLNDYMHAFNCAYQGEGVGSDRMQALLNLFATTMDFAYALFGDGAFRKVKANGRRVGSVNKALFEAWAVTLARINQNERQALLEKRGRLQDVFTRKMVENERFAKAVTQGTGSVVNVRVRFEEMAKLVEEVLYD